MVSSVEKGWAWVATASHRQGEKEREREIQRGGDAAIVSGGFMPKSGCHTMARPCLQPSGEVTREESPLELEPSRRDSVLRLSRCELIGTAEKTLKPLEAAKPAAIFIHRSMI
jgi:hypothetical protein